MRPLGGSSSSASRPTSLQRESKRSNSGFRIAALQYVVVDEPEAACQKNSLAGRQAVTGIFGFVSQNEFAIDQQSFFDRPKRSLDSWIGCWKKADERNQEQACVEPL